MNDAGHYEYAVKYGDISDKVQVYHRLNTETALQDRDDEHFHSIWSIILQDSSNFPINPDRICSILPIW